MNKQEEKIYAFFEGQSEEDISNLLFEFFTNVWERRRNEPFKGGLQACIVIFKDKSAMKICEEDGTATHLNTFINLVKYLNNDYSFLSNEETSNWHISKNERGKLYNEGIAIRILNGQDELMLSIYSQSESYSQYQIAFLNRIISLCKELKDTKKYKNVTLGLNFPKECIEFNDLSNDHYEKLLSTTTNLEQNNNLKH